jgi:hypothetical protein
MQALRKIQDADCTEYFHMFSAIYRFFPNLSQKMLSGSAGALCFGRLLPVRWIAPGHPLNPSSCRRPVRLWLLTDHG